MVYAMPSKHFSALNEKRVGTSTDPKRRLHPEKRPEGVIGDEDGREIAHRRAPGQRTSPIPPCV